MQHDTPLALARFIHYLVQTKGDYPRAAVKAEHDGADHRIVTALHKGAVGAGTSTDSSWAGPLTEFQSFVGDWFGTLRNTSLLDALLAEGARRIPANVHFALTSLGANGAVIDQADWFELEKLEFTGEVGGFKWSMAAVVFSDELSRFSNASARALINAELQKAVAAAANRSVIATLLDGVTIGASSGDARADLQTLFAAVPLGAASAPVLAAAPSVIKQLAFLGTTDGPPAFPEVRVPSGGFINGVPLVPVDQLGAYPSDGDLLMLIDANQIAADAGQLELEVAKEGNISMTDSTSGAVNNVSLYQTNAIAVRTRRVYSLQKVGTCVAACKNVSYGS